MFRKCQLDYMLILNPVLFLKKINKLLFIVYEQINSFKVRKNVYTFNDTISFIN